MANSERAFSFLPINEREEKPRNRGLTEIRGPYYDPLGKRHLADIYETCGDFVDILKFSGGSFTLMPEEVLKEIIALSHAHDVHVSTGGFIERVLERCPEKVDDYLKECKRLGFDVVEISSGFLAIPQDDLVRLTERVIKHGLKAKPEVNVQFGAGGTSSVEALEQQGLQDPNEAIREAKRHLDAGAYKIMVESEGITEQVREWRTDIISSLAEGIGIENAVFEAADPAVYEWYIKSFGPEVNLFVDHSQVLELEAMRAGVWGTNDLFGRVRTWKG
ncbi:phosphosulfolactate synthase [Halomonas alkaliantarctica]|nr:phosphosulfolactate synthase [Halomonas alkaliantarctica]